MLVHRWRSAQDTCKEMLGLQQSKALFLSDGEKINFEKCITENFLIKYGDNYFGKRDLLYIDLVGAKEVATSGKKMPHIPTL